MPVSPVSFNDILSASDLLSGKANKTPVITSRTLNRMSGATVFVKCENFQRTGAFKFRGAYNALSRLRESDKQRGVLTYSSGNHAQAIALAGSLLRIPTTIIMPDDAPRIKKEATLGYGAEVITYDKYTTTREDLARDMAAERGMTIIPPYDHPHVVAGQGTVGLELMQAAHELDYIYVCCGGGGLLSGCAIAAKHLQSTCKVIGVEPEAADDATRSFRTGTLQRVHNPVTIADGARTPYLGTITFPLVLKYVDDMITVSDAALIEAMRFFWERAKMIVEPTGALATAGLLSGQHDVKGARVGVVISGGNVDLENALMLFQRSSEE
ncbi:MAG: threo-3-hydroxy-L-aspartate ammonia-lyase [Bacteroidetes bacterium]|nr:threo-3-hydroxy-L-aspartate ammonia-lyase [Bacteroidota bacterium]